MKRLYLSILLVLMTMSTMEGSFFTRINNHRRTSATKAALMVIPAGVTIASSAALALIAYNQLERIPSERSKTMNHIIGTMLFTTATIGAIIQSHTLVHAIRLYVDHALGNDTDKEPKGNDPEAQGAL